MLDDIVEKEKLDIVMKIEELQAPADAAQTELNSMISLKRSIDMTIQEMIDMGMDISKLRIEASEIGKQVKEAAIKYGMTKIASEKAAQPLRTSLPGVNEEIESPLDYNRSQIKKMPISTDSIQMNVQYFSLTKIRKVRTRMLRLFLRLSASRSLLSGIIMIALENAKIASTLSAVATLDDGNNKMIDVNSIMNEMEDYIDRCVNGGNNIGVPINYYLKPVTQSMIARAWLAKYYPDNYNKAGRRA